MNDTSKKYADHIYMYKYKENASDGLVGVAMTFFPAKTTVKILKFGTPQTIAIIVLKIEKFDVT